MNHLTTQATAAPGLSLGQVTDLIADLMEQVAQKERSIQAVDEADKLSFAEADSKAAQDRLRERMLLEAELTQLRSRIQGAQAARDRMEKMAVYRGVRDKHREIEELFQRAGEHARKVDMHLHAVCGGINALRELGQEILLAMRGVRGRNTLGKDGWVAGASLAELADTEHYRFFAERHLAGRVPGWRTDWEPGPPFVLAALGNLEQVRSTIDSLLGPENFDPEIVKAVEQEQPTGGVVDAVAA